MYRVLEALRWEAPDWIVVPGGNLGNVSAFGKAFIELADLGLLEALPRLAVINAAGANTFFQLYETARPALERRPAGRRRDRRLLPRAWTTPAMRAATIASAIEINHPVNLPKALRALDRCGGVVREVTDQDILDAKAQGRGRRPGLRAGVGGQRRRRPAAATGRASSAPTSASSAS